MLVSLPSKVFLVAVCDLHNQATSVALDTYVINSLGGFKLCHIVVKDNSLKLADLLSGI